MAAKAGTDKEAAEAKGGKKKKGRPLLLIIIIVILLVVILALGALFFIFDGFPFSGGDDVQEEVVEQPRYLYSLQEFQVNLADPGTRRFLRTTLDLAYDEKSLTKELESRESEIRSLIISVLRSKYVVDLDEPGGMKGLEQDLLHVLNSALVEGEIKAIYYREFIFQ
jgi:flagellar FliL protein